MAERFKRIAAESGDEYIIPANLWQHYWEKTVNETLDEIINHFSLLDKLAIRVARLEVYYKTHRKEHLKK